MFAPRLSVLAHVLALREADSARIEQRFRDQERALDAALAATRTATEKADAANERRFESVNEFRNTLKDQQAQYITRVEMNAVVGDQGSYMTRKEMFAWVAATGTVTGIAGGFVGHALR